MKYQPKEIEPKWLTKWLEEKIYATREEGKKVYVLGMFPYPSGEGLHTGHVRIYTATDVIARLFRMKGYRVLFPMGWDAFGLPAENAAIKSKTNPMEMVPRNEANFRRQMEILGLSYDWEREFSTTDPSYYRWTQWLFLKLYSLKNEKGERLVYRKEVPINWCPFCKTGLANEEVLADGTHERCGTVVEKRLLPQWMMRITDYAERLLTDLDTVEWQDEGGKEHQGLDWPEGILEMQKNWIGRKEGVRVRYKITGAATIPGGTFLEVFTTRLDTIYGVSFMVVAPEKVKDWLDKGWIIDPKVTEYIKQALSKPEQQRLAAVDDKTGVDTGLRAVNPIDGSKIPIYVADYVLSEVGTGAVMGVPAHDRRDFEFAKKFGLEVKRVVTEDAPPDGSPTGTPRELQDSSWDGGRMASSQVESDVPGGAFEDDGVLINSGIYDGLSSVEAREKIFAELKKQGLAEHEVTYHLRDWIFSRQRYWGEPFPLVYCEKCGDENGVVTVPEKQLPVKLPKLISYQPSGTGESPLALASDWVNTTCPRCGGKARRETDTMPNWAGSCWYFLRFADTDNRKQAWSGEKLSKWLPVDWYLGGAEHAVLHLLYARFWIKAFYDLKLLKFTEPFLRLRSVGIVLAEDKKKMSKSLGNVVTPDEVVDKFGADAVRIYEMFMGPWEQSIAWETRALVGSYRFLDKLYQLATRDLEKKLGKSDKTLRVQLSKLVNKVESDIQNLKFNTAVAAMMKFTNSWAKSEGLGVEDLKILFITLAPLAPFMAEELYQRLAVKDKKWVSVHQQAWPEVEVATEEETVVVAVQVNGRLRDTINLSASEARDEDRVKVEAQSRERVKRFLEGKDARTVFVPGRLINFVV
ncbi:leucine--tRNA ligase [Candidatus Collierbacteria bacterium]|nr:leucine--tRNA ligase [Candidatus Collierbacteria bacterium]